MGTHMPERAPAVSVIMPTHNRAQLLGRSIQSVLGQSYTDIELLVIDDASSDETQAVVNSFDDARLRYLRLETNVGGGAARNIGVSHARAPIVAFQDSDDLWLPQKLERCLQMLGKNSDLVGVFSAFWQIQGRTSLYLPAKVPMNEQMAASILRENFIDTPTSLVRREAFQKVGGFDPNLPRYQDWDLFIRLLRYGKIAFIDEPLILSFVTPGSISANSYAHGVAMARIYEKHEAEIVRDNRLNASWLANMGDARLRAGEVAEGRRMLLRAWRLRPLHMGSALRVMVALGGSALYGHFSRAIESCRRGK